MCSRNSKRDLCNLQFSVFFKPTEKNEARKFFVIMDSRVTVHLVWKNFFMLTLCHNEIMSSFPFILKFNFSALKN